MFELPQLKYSYNSLEPYISEEILHFHHDKHHQAYLDKLNAVIQKNFSLQNKTIEEILSNASSLDEENRLSIVNNGGGYFNHNFYWEILGPNFHFDLNSDIGKEIIKKFQSYDNFKKLFSDKAINRFGSGYAWLVLNDSELEIMDTLNQDCPLSVGKKPLICIDVWEHAYYLQYQNRRSAYVEAWWNVINWEKVNENFLK